MTWPSYARWVAFAIVALAVILIFIFKKQIKARNKSREGKKVLFFKDGDEFLRWFAVLMLIYTFGKIGLYEANDYPFKWEHLMLHICRIHLIIMMVFLIIKKKELIKYVTYISSMGALMAFTFGSIDWSNNFDALGNATTFKGELLEKGGFTFYQQGPDNFFFWDFYITHIFITIFPIYMWTANSWKISTVNLHRAQLVYFIGIILIWTFNVLTQYMPEEWRANNWYIGMDAYNDYNDAIGWMSHWPQNLPCYLILGLGASMLLHLLWIAQTNIEVSFKGKFLSIKKNKNFKEYQDGYKNFWKNFIAIKK